MNLRRTCRIAAVSLVLPLALAAVGCSAVHEETCDGGWPVRDPQTAVQGLLEAAESSDYEKACSVISLKLDDEAIEEHLTPLKSEMDSKQVTSSNFKMHKYERGGSAHFYNVYAEQPEMAIDIVVVDVGKGYRVAFGEE